MSEGARPLLEARQVSKIYRRGRLGGSHQVMALDRVNLRLFPRRTVALIGASGSGKTTLGRCLAGMELPTTGEILFRGQPLRTLASGGRSTPSRVQMLTQDAALAIPPGFNTLEAIAEPLTVRSVGRRDAHGRAREKMAEVGLPDALARQRALDLSGGQLRRLLLARALLADPEVLILDEALSGLDLSLRAQVVNLLLDAQRRMDLAFLLIVHDLDLATWMADEIMIMDRGRVTEVGSVSEWLARKQPLTSGRDRSEGV